MGPFAPREADFDVSRYDANKIASSRSARCRMCIADVENRTSDIFEPGVYCIQNHHKIEPRFEVNAAVNHLSSSGWNFYSGPGGAPSLANRGDHQANDSADDQKSDY